MLHQIILIVIVTLSLFIVYKNMNSKKKAGDILFKGNASFKKGLVWTTTVLCVYYFSFEAEWFRFVVLLIVLLPVMTDKFYVGKHGIKIGFTFIPKEDILYYSQFEDSNEIHVYVKGIDNELRMNPDKGYRSKRLKDVMDTYLKS